MKRVTCTLYSTWCITQSLYSLSKLQIFYLLVTLGTQVNIKPAFQDASVQCSLLTTTPISTPKKQAPSHFVFFDSGLSDIDVDKQHHNQSTMSYIPSSDSCLSYVSRISNLYSEERRKKKEREERKLQRNQPMNKER